MESGVVPGGVGLKKWDSWEEKVLQELACGSFILDSTMALTVFCGK